MATNYLENFVITALPAGIEGTKLRIAVLVSPRLESDDPANPPATLDNWPDVRDWPSIAPTWKVTIKKGNKSFPLTATEVASEPYDLASWQQLFPGTATATPYTPPDRSQAPIFSYPVRKVVDTAKDLHTTVLRQHRTEFPSVAALEEMDSFQSLKTAADPNYEPEVLCSQLAGPISDDTGGISEAFILAAGFHGVRPCSQEQADVPNITEVSPDGAGTGGGAPIRIKGSNFSSSAKAVFDGIDATANVVTLGGTVLDCKVPAHAAGKVKVVVRNGDLLSNALDFTFSQGPK